MDHPRDHDDSARLIEAVNTAVSASRPINIVGGKSKPFLGGACGADALSTIEHSGITNYEPTELVVSVRCGTSLDALNQTLAANNQMLPFEPPVFPGGTIGGVLACGLSGSARPYRGSARDYVLGLRVVNGQGQALKFGGEVMKNVAGYDVSRLQVGAFGSLGLLLEASMKVLPKPEHEITLQNSIEEPPALSSMIRFARQPLPLTGAMVIESDQYIRLSGSRSAVEAAALEIGGTHVDDAKTLWQSVSNLTHPFFDDPRTLWRVSVPEWAPQAALSGSWLFDWGGAQRWLKTDEPASAVFASAAKLGGHATRFSSPEPDEEVFQPLPSAMSQLHTRLRDSFDPQRLFNPGRYYSTM